MSHSKPESKVIFQVQFTSPEFDHHYHLATEILPMTKEVHQLSPERVREEVQDALDLFNLSQSLLYHNRFVVIGCGKEKLDTKVAVTPDKLYTSKLFQLRLSYAKERHLAWAALSANYGFVFPTEKIMPYDLKMADLDKLHRLKLKAEAAAWFVKRIFTTVFVSEILFNPKDITIEVHAGQDYYDEFVPLLKGLGFMVETPVAGMSIGHQLKFYITELRLRRQLIPKPD